MASSMDGPLSGGEPDEVGQSLAAHSDGPQAGSGDGAAAPGADDAGPARPAARETEPRPLASALKEVERTAGEFGIRPELPEGRFVSALMTAIAELGRVSDSARGDFKQLFDQNREAAKDELLRAKEMTRAAQVSLSQARQAGLTYEVERENLVLRMIKETLPLFIEKMQGTLVLKEKRLNSDIQRRRYAVAGLVTLGLVCGGYGVRAWQDSDATEALGQCMVHPFQASGHLYCQLK